MIPRHDRVQLCGMLMRSAEKPRGKRKDAGSLSSAELMHLLSWVAAAKETLESAAKELNMSRAVLHNAQVVVAVVLNEHPEDVNVGQLSILLNQSIEKVDESEEGS